jgi:hypothetical protein
MQLPAQRQQIALRRQPSSVPSQVSNRRFLRSPFRAFPPPPYLEIPLLANIHYHTLECSRLR